MKRLALVLIVTFFSMHAQVGDYSEVITDPHEYFITKIPNVLALNLLYIQNFTHELIFLKIGDYTWRLPPHHRQYFPYLTIPVDKTKTPQHKPIEFLSAEKELIATLELTYETNKDSYLVTSKLRDPQGKVMLESEEFSTKIFNEVNLGILISDPGLQFTIKKLTKARLKR